MLHLKPADFDVTKHSDYFVWKDTLERVARRYDDTVDKKQVNSCVLKHLFCRELSNQTYCQKNRKCCLRRVTFSKFRAWRRKKNTALRTGFFENRALRSFN